MFTKRQIRTRNLDLFTSVWEYIPLISAYLFSDVYADALELLSTSVSARWRVPYAVEENLRGMNERMKERKTKSRAFYY